MCNNIIVSSLHCNNAAIKEQESLRQLTPLEKQRGEQLAQFLNGELDEHEEIGRLLECCQQVYSLYVKRPPLSQSPERIAYERQQATLLTKVNHLFLCKFE